MNDYDFENDFTSDEDVEEMLDSLTVSLGEQVECEESQDAVMHPMRAKALLCTYKVLKYLTKGSGAKVSFVINEPYNSMGSVSVVGEHITFRCPEWFLAAIKLASNFNVYPKVDGTVQMDFTFHGLTVPIER